ncbi:MAG: hypothetical protein JWP52_1809, partial [Rhizobacter sp.]|nr:hypothetical protein [Rhizobacter sp.]
MPKQKKTDLTTSAETSGALPDDPKDRYFVEKFIPYLLNQTATIFNQNFKK